VVNDRLNEHEVGPMEWKCAVDEPFISVLLPSHRHACESEKSLALTPSAATPGERLAENRLRCEHASHGHIANRFSASIRRYPAAARLLHRSRLDARRPCADRGIG